MHFLQSYLAKKTVGRFYWWETEIATVIVVQSGHGLGTSKVGYRFIRTVVNEFNWLCWDFINATTACMTV